MRAVCCFSLALLAGALSGCEPEMRVLTIQMALSPPAELVLPLWPDGQPVVAPSELKLASGSVEVDVALRRVLFEATGLAPLPEALVWLGLNYRLWATTPEGDVLFLGEVTTTEVGHATRRILLSPESIPPERIRTAILTLWIDEDPGQINGGTGARHPDHTGKVGWVLVGDVTDLPASDAPPSGGHQH